MKVLVVGSGGREHAICAKFAEDERITELFCAPGNGGISKIAKLAPYEASDIDGIVAFAKENSIDLTFVAPDAPLAMGMVDLLESEGVRVFGPTKLASKIEWSKAFSKEFMKKYKIPTAEYEAFTGYQKAIDYLQSCSYPIVIKADGLALGKGVIIANTINEAVKGVREIMIDKVFGVSGNSVVIEEFLVGREVSILAFCDGKGLIPMLSSQDHKKQYDGDNGLNTGGMGAFSPSPIYTEQIHNECVDKIFMPTLSGLQKEGIKYKGVIYFGLIITEQGPKILEYNARFGDPETQVILPLLETKLLDIVNAVIDERLSRIELKWKDLFASCVILASGGYPQKYSTSYPISGLEKIQKDVQIFHSGTKILNDGTFITNAGRVLGITGFGKTLKEASNRAYETVETINFKDMHFRKDIGR